MLIEHLETLYENQRAHETEMFLHPLRGKIVGKEEKDGKKVYQIDFFDVGIINKTHEEIEDDMIIEFEDFSLTIDEDYGIGEHVLGEIIRDCGCPPSNGETKGQFYIQVIRIGGKPSDVEEEELKSSVDIDETKNK